MMSYTFAKNLRRIRKDKGLSQEELAKLTGNISRGSISNYENEIDYPPLDKVYDLAKALKISPDMLLKDL